MTTTPTSPEALREQCAQIVDAYYSDGFGIDEEAKQSITSSIRALPLPTPSTDGVVVPEGMKAWHGGDNAPADWDGGLVRWATPPGYVEIGEKHPDQPWRHSVRGWFDIVAYTPAAPSDPVVDQREDKQP